MSIFDRIRGLFGRKESGAEYGAAATTGAVVAGTSGDPARDVDQQADSGTGGGDSGGSSSGGDGGGGGGDGSGGTG